MRKWKPTLNLSTGITFSEISLSVDRVKSAKYFAYTYNILLTYVVNPAWLAKFRERRCAEREVMG